MQTTKTHLAKKIRTTKDHLVLVLDDDRVRKIRWTRCSERLAEASAQERQHAYGIHWPLIDEDLTVNGILRQVK